MLLSLISHFDTFIYVIVALVIAISVHEFSHALIATKLGDMTAKLSGRLTLNPLSHLDPVGSLVLLLAGFGWGKPVPVNIFNLKYRRWGEAIVSLAGPVVNFLSVVLFVIVFKVVLNFLPATNLLFVFLYYLIIINLILGIFNLIPIPPLDGSKVLFAFLPERYNEFKRKMSINGMWILIGLLILDNITQLNIFGHIFGGFIDMINSLL